MLRPVLKSYVGEEGFKVCKRIVCLLYVHVLVIDSGRRMDLNTWGEVPVCLVQICVRASWLHLLLYISVEGEWSAY